MHASRVHEGKEKDKVSPDDETSIIQSGPTGTADLLRNITDILPLHIVAWPYLQHGIRTAEHQHIKETVSTSRRICGLATKCWIFIPMSFGLGTLVGAFLGNNGVGSTPNMSKRPKKCGARKGCRSSGQSSLSPSPTDHLCRDAKM
jgi:hypothetical protein